MTSLGLLESHSSLVNVRDTFTSAARLIRSNRTVGRLDRYGIALPSVAVVDTSFELELPHLKKCTLLPHPRHYQSFQNYLGKAALRQVQM